MTGITRITRRLMSVFMVFVVSSMMFFSSSSLAGSPNDDFISGELASICEERPNGNYPNPEDRTRFITCNNGNAADMACPDCDLANDPERCAGNKYLVWNDRVDVKRCEFPVTNPGT